MGAPLGGHMTSLSKEVIKGVAQIGNVMLVEAPVLLLCLSETLHQFWELWLLNARPVEPIHHLEAFL